MRFGELPRTAHAIWPAIIAGAATIGAALLSRNQGGGSSGSTILTPGARTHEGHLIWGEYLKRLQSGEIGRSSRALQGQLAALADSLGRPAYGINLGGQTVSVVPRRNIELLSALSQNAAQQFEANQYETNLLHDLALATEKLRYGLPGETGTLDQSPGWLDALGKGLSVGKGIYDTWPRTGTTPATTATNPYASHYNGQPLIGPGGRVVAI